MKDEAEPLSVEATGETVGEAKWHALRELEQLAPGLDKAAVSFQVLSEGERGLLGVGYAPARVVASVDAACDRGSAAGCTGRRRERPGLRAPRTARADHPRDRCPVPRRRSRRTRRRSPAR